MARLRRASFDDRLTLVEHLDELRTRIVVSAIVVVVAIGLCFWQNSLLLDIANEPLPGDLEPLTFSPTEPFFTTIKLAVYGGLLLSLPILLYQAYAYVLPAFSPYERRLVLPFLLMVPFLFIGGVVFAYFVVMPPALDFLLQFNADEFNIEVRASEYYGFFVLTLIALGILFQIPVGTLVVTRLGIVTPEQLARNRRYAVLVIAVAAMLLPGTDPVTMLLAMIPLYGLFELSLLLARAFGQPPSEAGDEPELSASDAPARGAG
ncbi:MAG: twin-arginine translocase subunit TatC [Solirubrobacterales bacterium]